MQPIIDLQNITVRHRDGQGIKSISSKIYEGDFVGIAGPNGAGKTTLLLAINGLSRVLDGSVNILGLEMNPARATRIRKQIGYVPQILNIDPRMPLRVKEVVMLGRVGRIGLLRRISFLDSHLVDEVMDLVGIRHLAGRPIGHLSGGEQRKVALARALAQEPRILLLDEPITHLDINAKTSMLELIDEIHEKRRLTTIMVMHNLDYIPNCCSRMILLKSSQAVFQGYIEQALNEELLSGLYGVKVEIIRNSHRIMFRAKT